MRDKQNDDENPDKKNEDETDRACLANNSKEKNYDHCKKNGHEEKDCWHK